MFIDAVEFIIDSVVRNFLSTAKLELKLEEWNLRHNYRCIEFFY